MTKIFLLVGIFLTGHEPQQVSLDMPDMDTCLQQVNAILNNPPDVLQREGGTLQASCALIFAAPHA